MSAIARAQLAAPAAAVAAYGLGRIGQAPGAWSVPALVRTFGNRRGGRTKEKSVKGEGLPLSGHAGPSPKGGVRPPEEVGRGAREADVAEGTLLPRKAREVEANGAEGDGGIASGARWEKWDRDRIRTGLFSVPVFICFGLGTWQLWRRDKKVKEMKERAWRLTLPPMGIAELACCLASPESECACEYRRVRLLGRFDESKSVLLGPRPKSMEKGMVENGYEVITPLTLHDGSHVLINRGWVPGRNQKEAWPAPAGGEEDGTEGPPAAVAVEPSQPRGWLDFWPFRKGGAGEAGDRADTSSTPGEAWVRGLDVSITGVVRGDDKAGWGVPGNNPTTGFWSAASRRQMAAAVGLSPVDTPYVEAAYAREGDGTGSEDTSEEEDALAEALLRSVAAPGDRPRPIPRRWSDFMQWRTTPAIHVVYATTWYALFVATALIFRRRVYDHPIRFAKVPATVSKAKTKAKGKGKARARAKGKARAAAANSAP